MSNWNTIAADVRRRSESLKKQYPEADLKRQFPALANFLQQEGGEPADPANWPRVMVAYLDFYSWLAIYDHHVSAIPLAVDVNSYLDQRATHFRCIREQLKAIRCAAPRTAQALAREIGRIEVPLPIFPWLFWKWGGMGAESSVHQDRDLQFEHFGTPIYVTAYLWNRGAVGGGCPAFMPNSPGTRRGTSGDSGPGYEADAVLFHELVHATRARAGAVNLRSVNPGYSNEEEFIAVVLANIYLSEKTGGKRWLRGNYETQLFLEDPDGFLDNSQKISPSPRELLERFPSFQPGFFYALAAIDVPFNPVKQFKEATRP
jgi:hypothetical protein